MLHLVALLSIFFSADAFACPDLTGKYLCAFGGEDIQPYFTSQRIVDGITYYSVNTFEFPANGSTVSLPDSEILRNATMSATCVGEALKVNYKGDYYQNHRYLGKLDMKVSNTLHSSNDYMLQYWLGTVVLPDGNIGKMNATYPCFRKTTTEESLPRLH